MSKDKQKEKPKRGCVPRAFFMISAALTLLLAVAVIISLLPQDTSTIKGYGEGAKSREVRDLKEVLSESLERGHEITISEEELNRWIGQTLKVEQKGLLGGVVKINGVGIRLNEDEVEVVMERSFIGLTSTFSMYFQVLVDTDGIASKKEVPLHGGPIAKFFPALKRGGRFGQLTVPQGYLYLIKPAFFQLGEVYDEELEMAFRKMHDIQIGDGQVVFVPRPIDPNAP